MNVLRTTEGDRTRFGVDLDAVLRVLPYLAAAREALTADEALRRCVELRDTAQPLSPELIAEVGVALSTVSLPALALADTSDERASAAFWSNVAAGLPDSRPESVRSKSLMLSALHWAAAGEVDDAASALRFAAIAGPALLEPALLLVALENAPSSDQVRSHFLAVLTPQGSDAVVTASLPTPANGTSRASIDPAPQHSTNPSGPDIGV